MLHIIVTYVATMGSMVRGAAAATTAQHDHFDQVQLACVVAHVHIKSLPLL